MEKVSPISWLELFGGGGHEYASGFKVTDGRSVDQIKQECIENARLLLDNISTDDHEKVYNTLTRKIEEIGPEDRTAVKVYTIPADRQYMTIRISVIGLLSSDMIY